MSCFKDCVGGICYKPAFNEKEESHDLQVEMTPVTLEL